MTAKIKLVWIVVGLCVSAGLSASVKTSSAVVQETLHYVPYNYQDDVRQPKTLAELKAEVAGLEGTVPLLYYGAHGLTVIVYPYIVIPKNHPTVDSACGNDVGLAWPAAITAGYNLGQPSQTNIIWFRSPTTDDLCAVHYDYVGGQNAPFDIHASLGVLNYLYYGTTKGLNCCSWTSLWWNGSHSGFVTLRDTPPAVATDAGSPWRIYKAMTGQGDGPWTTRERVAVGALTDANAIITVTNPPALGQSQTYTIMPVDEQSGGVTAKRLLVIPAMGLELEARYGPQRGSWDEGLIGFTTDTHRQVDFLPLTGSTLRQPDSMALPANFPYVDPTNTMRITMVSLTATAAMIRLDHGSDTAPPPPCTTSPSGVIQSSIAVDGECATWKYGPSTYGGDGQNFEMFRNGLNNTGGWSHEMMVCNGVLWAHAVVSNRNGTDAWYRWQTGGFINPQSAAPCGSAPPPPPSDKTPPTVQSATATSSSAVVVVAIDDVAVVRVEFYRDGALVDTATAAPWTKTIPLAVGAPNVMSVKAFDAAGNGSAVVPVIVK